LLTYDTTVANTLHIIHVIHDTYVLTARKRMNNTGKEKVPLW